MEKNWWRDAVVYQVYPRSFKDSNGDGVGDIPGIIEKLDYLAELGIGAIWLCPVFRSPMVDNGYDISNYQDIAGEFGTLADMEKLIAEADSRGIKILLDLVLNHSSDQHPWFKSAIAEKESPCRDYYLFRRGRNGKPPNNWRSVFGGSAWEPAPGSAATGGGTSEEQEYYFHTFAKAQPDLNWENPALRAELYRMIRWWMDRGVAGFRIDAISYIKKDPAYPDLPSDGPDGLADATPCFLVYPGIEKFLAEMRDQVFRPRGAFTVAEAYGVRPENLEEFAGEGGFFSAIFDFSYTDLENGTWSQTKRPSPAELRELIFKSQRGLIAGKAVGAPYLENHDQNRTPDRYLPPEHRTREGKTLLGTLFFFLRGVPFIYQGQELGIGNYPWQSMDEFNDVASFDQYQRALALGFSKEESFGFVRHRSRDNARIPMCWDSSAKGGFSAGKPWLPVHPDHVRINAEAERADPRSVFSFYKKLIVLRKEHPDLFFAGEFIPRFEELPELIAYERALRQERALILCNFSAKPLKLDTGTLKAGKAIVWLGNLREAGETVEGTLTLDTLEALVLGLGGDK
jgi:alpha-glucosidase